MWTLVAFEPFWFRIEAMYYTGNIEHALEAQMISLNTDSQMCPSVA